MQHKTGFDRNQIQMLFLEQMVEKQALVRVIDAFVDMLDMEVFELKQYTLKQRRSLTISSLQQ